VKPQVELLYLAGQGKASLEKTRLGKFAVTFCENDEEPIASTFASRFTGTPTRYEGTDLDRIISQTDVESAAIAALKERGLICSVPTWWFCILLSVLVPCLSLFELNCSYRAYGQPLVFSTCLVIVLVTGAIVLGSMEGGFTRGLWNVRWFALAGVPIFALVFTFMYWDRPFAWDIAEMVMLGILAIPLWLGALVLRTRWTIEGAKLAPRTEAFGRYLESGELPDTEQHGVWNRAAFLSAFAATQRDRRISGGGGDGGVWPLVNWACTPVYNPDWTSGGGGGGGGGFSGGGGFGGGGGGGGGGAW
jgi:uncharacterized membrane protein YgcG